MKRLIAIICAFLGGGLLALGFNTIEYMCHYSPPKTWCFIWPDQFCMPFWYAYMLGGIFPFMSGSMMLGIIIGIAIPILYKKFKQR